MIEKKRNWLSGIFVFIGTYKGPMIGSIGLAVLSVACGLIPYFAVSRIIIMFLQNRAEMDGVAAMAALALGGYALQRLFFSTATVLSHKTAFQVLKNIRSAIAEKLIRMPMGTIMSKSSGQYKDILVDEVELHAGMVQAFLEIQFCGLLHYAFRTVDRSARRRGTLWKWDIGTACLYTLHAPVSRSCASVDKSSRVSGQLCDYGAD